MFQKTFLSVIALFIFVNMNYAQPNAGDDQVICSDETQLEGNEPPGGVIGTWSVVTGSAEIQNETLYNSQVTELGKGSNILRWTFSGNSDDVVITNKIPTVGAGPNQTTCNDYRTMSANEPEAGESGIWQQLPGGHTSTITYNTLYNTTVTNLPFGVSSYKWTITKNGCSAEDIMEITSNKVTANAGDDVSSCNGTAVISAVDPAPATGTWDALGAGTIEYPDHLTTNVSDLNHGLNSMRWSILYEGCTDEDEMTIQNTEVLASAGFDQIVCDQTTTLSANNASGEWTCTNPSVTIESPSTNMTDVEGLTIGGSVIFTWTVTENDCSNSDDVTVTNDQIFAEAGDVQIVCTFETKLDADPPGAGVTGNWTVTAGLATISNPEKYNTDVSGLMKGVNGFKWEIDNGNCTDADIVEITNMLPSEAIVSPDAEICADQYGLTGNEPGAGETGLWTKEGGAVGNIISPSNYVTDVTSIGQGANTFRWTISNGTCENFAETTITNSSISTSAGDDEAICDTKFKLNAEKPDKAIGTWYLINSGGTPVFDDETAHDTYVRNLAKGPNVFSWSITNGTCSDEDIVTIINNIPTEALAGKDKTVCSNSGVLMGNNPSVGSGVWTLKSGAGIIENPSNYTTSVNNLNEGDNEFSWTITQGDCSSDDEVVIRYNIVTSDASDDVEICSTSYMTLDGSVPLPGETGVWTVSGGSGEFADKNQYNTSVSGLLLGDNLLTWTISEGDCSAVDDVLLINNAPVQAIVSADQEICTNITTIYGNPPTIGTGEWSLVSGGGIFENYENNQTEVTEIPENSSQYKWTITNENCSTDATITITNNTTESHTGNNINVCGSSAFISANEPEQGEYGVWSLSSGTGSFDDASYYFTQVTDISYGVNIYRWTMHKGICTDSDNQSVTNNLIIATATVSGPSEICTNHSAISGNIPGATSAEGTWSVMSGNGNFDDEHEPSTQVNDLDPGVNVLRWTISNMGCVSWDEITITNSSVIANAGADIISCEGYATLSAEPLLLGESGLWTLQSGDGDIENPDEEITNVTGLNHGANVFRWTVNKGECEDYDNVVVSLNSFNTSAGLDKSICTHGTTLSGSNPAPGTGIWTIDGSPGVTIEEPTNYATAVSGISNNSVNVFRWTVQKFGCTAYDEVTVTNEYINSYAGSDQFVCESHTIMSAIEPTQGVGEWIQNSGGGYITDPLDPQTEVTSLALGQNVFTWTVTNGVCTSQDQIIIDYEGVTANAGNDQTKCSSTATLSASPPPVGGSGEWAVTHGPGQLQNYTLFNSQVTNLQMGLNTLRWTVSKNGCSDDDHVNITNNDFIPYAGEDQLLSYGTTSTYLEAELEAGTTGVWSILSGSGSFDDYNDPETQVTGMITGWNTFQWRVQMNGCESTDIVIVTVRDFEAYAGDDNSICADSAQLGARDEGSSQQHWGVLSGNGDFADETDPNTWVHNLERGENVFRWYVTINSYTSFDDVVITDATFDIFAGEDAQVNQPEYIMNAEPPGNNGTGIWLIADYHTTGTFENNTLYNSVVTGLNDGENKFKWEVVRNGCMNDDTVVINYVLTDINNPNLKPILLYPNPATTYLNIELTESDDYDIIIYDLTGRKLISEKVHQQKIIKLKVSTLSAGVYKIIIESEKLHYIRTIVINE